MQVQRMNNVTMYLDGVYTRVNKIFTLVTTNTIDVLCESKHTR